MDIIIYSFHYLLDPKVAEQVSKEMSKDAIVVFDEAHNIGRLFYDESMTITHLFSDNVCIESLSIDLTRPMLDSAARSINKLSDKIEELVLVACLSLKINLNCLRIKVTDAAKLQNEYTKLVEGLQEDTTDPEDNDGFMTAPGKVLPAGKWR